MWCNRHRDCFMLELGLHSCSAMNWVNGLRFSIPHLAGQLPCSSPLIPSPFSGETDDQEWSHRYGALGVIGILSLWASDVSAYLYILDFWLYIVIYISDVYFIYWISSVDVDFQIFINRDFIYYYLSHYFYYYVNQGVTSLLSTKLEGGRILCW